MLYCKYRQNDMPGIAYTKSTYKCITLSLLHKKQMADKPVKQKYFIEQYLEQEYQHGGITGVDAEKVLLAKGFTPVSFPHHYDFSVKAKMNRLLFLFKKFFSVERGSVVVFLFPVYAKMNRLLIRLFRFKGIRLICFIADIDGLRDEDQSLLRKEIRQLKRLRFFIVHNNKMASYLQKFIPQGVFSLLDFFDYLAPPYYSEKQKGYSIVFAGNLEKSRFLSLLNQIAQQGTKLHFNLYGPGISEQALTQENVSYHGIYKPYDIPSKVQGSFGLIWDGESIHTCSGGYGEYLQYNSQHKLSLYILTRLPVIIWEEAATAELVKKFGIGFTIKSLFEIEDKITMLSEAEYRQMQINMQPLADKISKGECLGNAINEIMKGI